MKHALQILAATTTGLSLCGLVGWGLYGSSLTRCSAVEVIGTGRASPVEVRHLADIALGQPLISVDLDAAVAGVERHPWVAQAKARRAFPNRVVVTVTEREPKAMLLLDQLYLVDKSGKVFRKADGVSRDLPVITGIPEAWAASEPHLAQRLVNDAVSLLDAPEIAEKNVSEVRFDERAGYVIVLRNGGSVLLGFSPSEALPRLGLLASSGVDLSVPHRVDLGSPRLAVVTPL